MTDRQKHYSTIIIGATFYGCGLGVCSSDHLILESTNHVGTDFVFSFNPGRRWAETVELYPEAEELQTMLREKEILKGNRLHCGGLAGVMAAWCLKHNLNLELLSDVIAVAPHSVAVLNCAGKTMYTADRIIDARMGCSPKKSITALLHHPPRRETVRLNDDFEIVGGPFDDESYLIMDVPSEMSWPDARNTLHHAWRTRTEPLRNWQLVLIGSRFCFHRFANPLQALNAGLKEGKS